MCDFLNTFSTNETTETFLVDIRVKVNRKLLEQMLNADDSSPSAEDFFVGISTQSGAIISYPLKEKLHLIAKKDPEVRIIGLPLEIHNAKSLIMEKLAPHKDRITLKVDVSHSDHSHVIGKAGKRIQSIMDSTQCHIHFPDGNRTNCVEKSNQVTIAGTSIDEVEQARQMIRQYLPITVSFEAPVNSSNIDLFNAYNPKVQFYQKRYTVFITFRLPDLPVSDKCLAIVMVRGSRMRFQDVKDVVRNLYQDMNHSSIGFNNMLTTISLEIAAQHHSYVTGKNNCNVKAIEEHTGAVVSFPEMTFDSFSQSLPQKTTVTIRGRGIDSGFMAWVELMEYLPAVLIFDLKPDQEIDGKLFTSLMSNQLISIMIKSKLRSDVKSIVIKSQERHVHQLFEARQRIMNMPSDSSKRWPKLFAIEDKDCALSGGQTSLFPRYLLDLEPETIRSVNRLSF